MSGMPVFQEAGMTLRFGKGPLYEPIVAMDAKGNALYFPTLIIDFQVFEREKSVASNFEALTDIYIEEDLISDGYAAYPILNFNDGYVEPNLTITSFNPTTAGFSGNTPVAIMGTGFQAGAVSQVIIAGIPATFGRSQPNLLIVFTGTVLNPQPPGPIVIVDTSGNTYTSTGNFSYA